MREHRTGRAGRGTRCAAAGFAAVLAVGAATMVSAPSQASAPTSAAGASACTTNWGSWAKTAPDYSWSQVLRVRAGEHACYDRMVVDLRGTLRGYDVRYARAYTEGVGQRVWLKGDDELVVVVRGPAYNSRGEATYRPRWRYNAVDVDGFRTIKQIAFLGSVEGQSSFGVGTRARLPMRAFILRHDGGSKLVIDVAHTW